MTDSEQIVTPLLLEMLGLREDEVDPELPLGELGIDSLTAAELSAAIEDAHGIIVPLERFLGEESLAAVERDVAGQRARVAP